MTNETYTKIRNNDAADEGPSEGPLNSTANRATSTPIALSRLDTWLGLLKRRRGIQPRSRGTTDDLQAYGRFCRVFGPVGLTALSALTTYEGMQTFLPGDLTALLGAASLHAAMFGLEIQVIHARTARPKLFSFPALLTLALVSMTFSFIGLWYMFGRIVIGHQKPIIEHKSLIQNQERLQTQAINIQANGIEYFEQQLFSIQANLKLANANKAAKQKEAAECQTKLNTATDPIQIARLRSRLAAAQATGDALRLKVNELTNEIESLRSKLNEITSYEPAFLTAGDSDSLIQEYQQLSRIWTLLPKAFKETNQLPAVPHEPGSHDGMIPQGQDHPTIEALKALLHPGPQEWLPISLALIFDFTPFMILFSTREKYSTIPERLSTITCWIREVDQILRHIPGIVPWGFRSIMSLLFSGRVPLRTPKPDSPNPPVEPRTHAADISADEPTTLAPPENALSANNGHRVPGRRILIHENLSRRD